MKEIKLTRGVYALVDDDDYEYLNRYNWHANKGTSGYYARNYTLGKMHRLIMNAPMNMVVDHKDRNTLNNQKSNLRICNRSENNSNREPKKTGTSRYLGVSVIKFKSRHIKSDTIYKYYLAGISVNNITVHKKTFKNEIDAAKQYDTWAKDIHGEFANLNFK